MIFDKNYLERDKHKEYVQLEKEGLQRAVSNLEKRYQNGQIERQNFMKGLNNFAKKGEDLNKRMNNLK